MKVLLDSSTLIAALLPDHAHHVAAHAWLSQAKSGGFDLIVSSHSLAEVYSVLTRLPRSPMISPAEARQLLTDNIISCAEIVALSRDEYVLLIEDLARQGIAGGLVYDGIIAKAAELSNVDKLVTINDVHFQKVWPAGSVRIVNPTKSAPPK